MDICDGILLIQVFLRSCSDNVVASVFAVIIGTRSGWSIFLFNEAGI